MKMKKALILSAIAGVAHTVLFSAIMPEKIAVKFAWDGNAFVWAGIFSHVAFTTLLFGGMTLMQIWVAGYFQTLPIEKINLPQKQYWFAPERKNNTLQFIETRLYQMGIFTNVFIILVMELLYQANQSEPIRLNMKIFLSGLSLYIGLIFYFCFSFYGFFNRKVTAA